MCVVRGVEVCGKSEVCGRGGVDVGGGSMSVLLYIVYRCSHMCIVCVCCVCFVCVMCVCVCVLCGVNVCGERGGGVWKE